MGSAALAARLVLAAVFVVAGVGKLMDLRGSRRALVGFGVPESVANIAGTGLPIAELATAALLVFRPTAVVGAVLAFVLLLSFIAGMANALRRGEAPDCHCFGAIHSAPVGRGHIVRNVLLAALALFVIVGGPGPAVDSWISAHSAAVLVAVATGTAALVLLAVAVQGRLEIGRLRTELEAARAQAGSAAAGLGIGSGAPPFAVPASNGDVLTLASLCARRRPVLLVFTSAGCGPCEALVPELGRLQVTLADRLTIGVVGTWTIERYEAAREAHFGVLTLADAREEDHELNQALDDLVKVFEAYRLKATPSAVVVSPEGTIASATVNGRPAIEALIRLTLDRMPSRHSTLAFAETAAT